MLGHSLSNTPLICQVLPLCRHSCAHTEVNKTNTPGRWVVTLATVIIPRHHREHTASVTIPPDHRACSHTPMCQASPATDALIKACRMARERDIYIRCKGNRYALCCTSTISALTACSCSTAPALPTNSLCLAKKAGGTSGHSVLRRVYTARHEHSTFDR